MSDMERDAEAIQRWASEQERKQRRNEQRQRNKQDKSKDSPRRRG